MITSDTKTCEQALFWAGSLLSSFSFSFSCFRGSAARARDPKRDSSNDFALNESWVLGYSFGKRG